MRASISRHARLRTLCAAFLVVSALAIGCGGSNSPASSGATVRPAASGSTAGVPFSNGDLFVGVGYGRWNQFNANGQLVATLDNGHKSSPFTDHSTAGACFDADGNMYAADFADSTVSKFSRTGALIDDTIVKLDSYPESCLVVGDFVYVSLPYGTGDIVKLSLDGTEVARYDVERSDWIDLAADHCTMFYTDEGPSILRYDVCKDQAIADFASPGGENFALRLLPDQSVLVASDDGVKHLSPAGALLATFTAPDEDAFFSLNLDPDGQHFWTAALKGSKVYKFAIAPPGPPILEFDGRVDLGAGKQVSGLSLYGEPTAATPAPIASSGPLGIDWIVWLALLVVWLVIGLLIVAIVVRRQRRRRQPTQVP